MEEHVFFDNGDVKVTNARFVSNGQTYVMSNVTSVKSLVEVPSRISPVVLVIIGAVISFFGLGNSSVNASIIGIACVAVGVLWFVNVKKKYFVSLATASGEKRALSSEDESFIDAIVNSLNDAIVHRG